MFYFKTKILVSALQTPSPKLQIPPIKLTEVCQGTKEAILFHLILHYRGWVTQSNLPVHICAVSVVDRILRGSQSIKNLPRGPKVCRYYLHWYVWSPRVPYVLANWICYIRDPKCGHLETGHVTPRNASVLRMHGPSSIRGPSSILEGLWRN